MVTSNCKWCGTSILRNGSRAGIFCSLSCKGAWQQTQKPVDKEWLYEEYVVKGRSTYSIGQEVRRNSKQVYQWLKGYDIPTRCRPWSTEPSEEKPYQSEEWLRAEYVTKGRSAHDIAHEFGVTDANILFFLRRFGIARRTMAQARALKHWALRGAVNGMFGKRGPEVPNWKGGITPERQALYSSLAWASAVKIVWRRDAGTCQRCAKQYHWPDQFAIHHIVSFAVKELRAEPANLVLLCLDCHHWVHSALNKERLFLGQVEGGEANERANHAGGLS